MIFSNNSCLPLSGPNSFDSLAISYRSFNFNFPFSKSLPSPPSKVLYRFFLSSAYEDEEIILSAVINARANVSAPPI